MYLTAERPPTEGCETFPIFRIVHSLSNIDTILNNSNRINDLKVWLSNDVLCFNF